MMTFMIGLVVGFVLFAIAVSVNLFNRIQVKLVELVMAVDNLQKLSATLLNKTVKIEQMSQLTMEAAETFVDGLRASAELPSMPPPDSESFDDLRQTFQDGIKDMEDDEGEEPEEPWKKK